MAAAHLGHVGGTLGHILFAISIFAAALSFHNTIARYAFALGREHVLPRVFRRTCTSEAPRAASLTQTVIGLTVIVGYAAAGADPVVRLFYLASTSGALSVLLLLFTTGVPVLGCIIADRRGEPLWRTRIAPILSLAWVAVWSLWCWPTSPPFSACRSSHPCTGESPPPSHSPVSPAPPTGWP